MSNSPSRSCGAFLRPGFCILASLTPNRGVGGAPIRRPYILTSPQVASEDFKGLAFFSCGPLTPPLPSSGYIDSNLDRAWGFMRAWNKLSASFVRSVRREGRYSDGGNLYLQVANGGKSWVFQYQRHGRQRDMGLGSARSVSLALARELRDDCHVKLARGLDPIEARNSAVLAARAERAKQMTFRQCAEDYLAVNASKWRNAKHRKQWAATLTRYAYPVFGNLSVAADGGGAGLKGLKPGVARKAGDGEPCAWPHRDGARLRPRGRPPRRRHPRRQGHHRPSAAAALREGWREASAGAPLGEGTGVHDRTAQNARIAGAVAGANHSQRHAPRCSAAGALWRAQSGSAWG